MWHEIRIRERTLFLTRKSSTCRKCETNMMILVLCLLVKLSRGCPYIDNKNTTRLRLPRALRPISYDITLKPELIVDSTPEVFYGNTDIKMTVVENTTNITLHACQLNIDDNRVSVRDIKGNLLNIKYFTRNELNEFYTITLEKEIIQGKVLVVSISYYKGILRTDNNGVYLGTYMEDGIKKRFVTTQFESTHARRAFPCFDEPEFKATFKIIIMRPQNYSSISNEALLSSTPLSDGLFKDVYAETAVMSTYLVALVVSQYTFIQQDKQRVFARAQAVKDGWCEYALHTGIKTKEALQDYLKIEHALSKLDHVAIPDLYSIGAMENWGLITYREPYLLFSPNYSTTHQLQKICMVIAHEFSHQWFGNLVTLQWWKYMWLNEGFATYFEFFVASLIEPTWRLMEQFIFSVHDALEYDSGNSSTPLNYEGPSDSGAPTLITYDKAGSILRMMEHILTKDVYKHSLHIYLTKRKFSTSTPQDLYDAFQEAVDNHKMTHLLGGYNVGDVLTPWTDQEGYPVVTVTRNYNTGIISLKQKRFLLKNYIGANTQLTWPIPINFLFSDEDSFDFSKTTADYWFNSSQTTLRDHFPVDGFVIANKQQTGFYRVNYDIKNWYRITQHLTTSKITDIAPVNRAQLIDDAFNLAKAGLLSYTIAFDLSRYVVRETDYIPIMAFLEEMSFLREKTLRSEEETLLNKYILEQLTAAAQQLSFYDKKDEAHVTKLNRVAVMRQICHIGSDIYRSSCLDTFHQWKYNNTMFLSPDMQEYVICCALRNGDKDDWNYMYERYLNEPVEILKMRILNALGCTEHEGILFDYLNKIVDTNSSIRNTDRQTAFQSVYTSGAVGLNISLLYLRSYFDLLKQSSLNVPRIIGSIAFRLHTPKDRLLIKECAEVYGYDHFGYALMIIDENLKWNKNFMPTIQKWLKTRIPSINY